MHFKESNKSLSRHHILILQGNNIKMGSFALLIRREQCTYSLTNPSQSNAASILTKLFKDAEKLGFDANKAIDHSGAMYTVRLQ